MDSLRKSLGAARRQNEELKIMMTDNEYTSTHEYIRNLLQQNEDLKNKILAIRCEVAKIKYDIKTKWWSHEIPDELVQRLRKLAE